MKCCNCPYANEHIDYSTTSVIQCKITGDINHWNDSCDCIDKNAFYKSKKSLFSIFKRSGVKRK